MPSLFSADFSPAPHGRLVAGWPRTARVPFLDTCPRSLPRARSSSFNFRRRCCALAKFPPSPFLPQQTSLLWCSLEPVGKTRSLSVHRTSPPSRRSLFQSSRFPGSAAARASKACRCPRVGRVVREFISAPLYVVITRGETTKTFPVRADDRWLEVVRASWEDRCSSKGRRRGVGRRAVGEHLAGHGRRCPVVVLPFLCRCVFRSSPFSFVV